MKKLLAIGTTWLLLAAAPTAFSADCVEVDIELTPEVVVGPGNFGEGFFELTNCGDEADTVQLSFTIDLGLGQPFEIHAIPIPIGAGETISREFRFPAPPVAAGVTVTFCVTATLGTAEASDCASVTFLDDGSGSPGEFRRFGMEMTAAGSTDCIEFDFEISDTVYTTPGDFFAEAYFELTNCGDTATTVYLEVSIDILPPDATVTIPVRVGAGETISREFRFPVPPALPEGDYAITVTATAGDAMVSKTEIVTVLAGSPGGSTASDPLGAVNYPNPFNPATQISFRLPQAGAVSLVIYNMLGQQVRTLLAGEYLNAGDHTVTWDGTDATGKPVASGVYLYRLTTDQATVTKKMMLTK